MNDPASEVGSNLLWDCDFPQPDWARINGDNAQLPRHDLSRIFITPAHRRLTYGGPMRAQRPTPSPKAAHSVPIQLAPSAMGERGGEGRTSTKSEI